MNCPRDKPMSGRKDGYKEHNSHHGDQGENRRLQGDAFVDFMRDLIDWLSRNDPDTVAAIEKNFDEFVKWAKEKYQ